jgi:tetratricopeptide (TPR) repeat protein
MRRTKNLRYKGVVHESIATWLSAPGRRSVRLSAPLLHFGYLDEVWVARKKSKRNLRLLRSRQRDDPGDPVISGFIAEELLKDKCRQEALIEARHGWALARNWFAHQPRSHRPAIVQLATTLAWLELGQSNTHDVERIAADCDRWGFDHPNVHHLLGLALEIAAQASPDPTPLLERAAESYIRCMRPNRNSGLDKLIPGVLGHRSQMRLGLVCFKLGHHHDAIGCFNSALAEAPGDPGTIAGLADTLNALKRHAVALKTASTAFATEHPAVWLAAAESLWMLGRIQDAQTALAKLEGRSGRLRERHRIKRYPVLLRLVAEHRCEEQTGFAR